MLAYVNHVTIRAKAFWPQCHILTNLIEYHYFKVSFQKSVLAYLTEL